MAVEPLTLAKNSDVAGAQGIIPQAYEENIAGMKGRRHAMAGDRKADERSHGKFLWCDTDFKKVLSNFQYTAISNARPSSRPKPSSDWFCQGFMTRGRDFFELPGMAFGNDNIDTALGQGGVIVGTDARIGNKGVNFF